MAPGAQVGGATSDMQTRCAGPRIFGVCRNGVKSGSALNAVQSEPEANGTVVPADAVATPSAPTATVVATAASKVVMSFWRMILLCFAHAVHGRTAAYRAHHGLAV